MLNEYGVEINVWRMWTNRGRAVFNDTYEAMSLRGYSARERWNTAFFIACEVSNLKVAFNND